ncbi:hypothetical protein MMH89_00705 [Candidatus Comchoanobacter bicostacola]|uniref:Dephospho-CoA kinase n=1 Tax=Candidatus Comchoanobacter bicostacola TaxID=2919598 RepID=A0ABY5DL37_9GAMM|nr:hypothetical protein [Candidatus Comchoanobacter bicostacola]UTC24683.1 hypothetical protein MMH89_00705 [Candidatus Comchoanobacter bicostacola]
MSFTIAIIGGYGVGKSILRDHFESLGVAGISIDTLLSHELRAHYSKSEANEYLLLIDKSYKDILRRPEYITSKHLLNVIKLNILMRSEEGKQPRIIEFPSFIDVRPLMEKGAGILDYVIQVMCPIEKQKEYLLGAYHLSDEQVRFLVDEDPNEGCCYSTDIFFNAVTVDQVKWVCAQLLSSYYALNR